MFWYFHSYIQHPKLKLESQHVNKDKNPRLFVNTCKNCIKNEENTCMKNIFNCFLQSFIKQQYVSQKRNQGSLKITSWQKLLSYLVTWHHCFFSLFHLLQSFVISILKTVESTPFPSQFQFYAFSQPFKMFEICIPYSHTFHPPQREAKHNRDRLQSSVKPTCPTS